MKKKKKAVLLKMSFFMPRSFQEGFPNFYSYQQCWQGEGGAEGTFPRNPGQHKASLFLET